MTLEQHPGRDPGRRTVALLAWVVLLLGALGSLHVLGRGPLTTPPLTRPGALGAWLDQQSATTVAFSALRLAAMTVAWYLLAITFAGLLTGVAGAPRWSAAVDALSPTVVRRLVQGGAGLTVAAAVSSTQAAAWAAPGGQPTAPSPAPIMRRLPAIAPPVTTPPSTAPPSTAPPKTAPPQTTAPVTTAPPPAPPAAWVIRPGDNLWSVAEATLARAWGRTPSDAEVDGYWTGLITANRSRLIHRDDPDLVFPGQVFVLPVPPAAGQR